MPNSWKSALVPFFADIPVRTGFVGEMRYGLLNDARKLNKKKLPLMVERFAQLAEAPRVEIPRPLSSPHLQVSDAQRAQTLAKLGLTLDKPVAVFCPGAEYGPAKRWPAHYYAELAQLLRMQGYAVWLIGSPKDKEVADKIIALGNEPCRNLCGVTDLAEAIALLSCADLVVSNDSGLMHIAAALRQAHGGDLRLQQPAVHPASVGQGTGAQARPALQPLLQARVPAWPFQLHDQNSTERSFSTSPNSFETSIMTSVPKISSRLMTYAASSARR